MTFQLEIRGSGISAVSQILRVVDGSKSQSDLGSPGRSPLRTRGTAKRRAPESQDQVKAKTIFQPTPARLRTLPRSSTNLQKEIAARPPDIQLASDQNAAPLPFGPRQFAAGVLEGGPPDEILQGDEALGPSISETQREF